MRRIYYRFPQRVDLSFAMGMPFKETLNYITSLNGKESTKIAGQELIKVRLQVQVAMDRATFGPITADLVHPGVITEAVDFRIAVQATALRGGGKVPVASDVFYVRLTDRVRTTDCDIAKEGNAAGLDALDLKNMILGA